MVSAALKSDPRAAVLRRVAWPPIATLITVRSVDRPAPSGKAAVTFTRRSPAPSAREVCTPSVSGSTSAANTNRCGVLSASVRVMVRAGTSTVNPAGAAAVTVRVSAGSSNPSSVPVRLKAAEASVCLAGMVTVISAITW